MDLRIVNLGVKKILGTIYSRTNKFRGKIAIFASFGTFLAMPGNFDQFFMKSVYIIK